MTVGATPRPATVLLTGGPGSTLGAMLLTKLQGTYRIAATSREESRTTHPAGSECVSLYRVDVSQPSSVNDLVASVERDFGEIDVLINNAAAFRGGLLAATRSEDWQYVIDVNLTGVFHVCRTVSRRMMRQRGGKIINVVSRKGITGGYGEAAYAASKAGVIALTKSLARELAPYDIAVNAVCPGFMRSRLNGFDDDLFAREADLAAMDIERNAEDTANFIAFLCGNGLASVTGQIFHIDSRIN